VGDPVQMVLCQALEQVCAVQFCIPAVATGAMEHEHDYIRARWLAGVRICYVKHILLVNCTILVKPALQSHFCEAASQV
jgi:hypothetical protein